METNGITRIEMEYMHAVIAMARDVKRIADALERRKEEEE